MNMPNDPMILLSYVNTQLRDFYPSLHELCLSADADEEALKAKLAAIDYEYDEKLNRFV